MSNNKTRVFSLNGQPLKGLWPPPSSPSSMAEEASSSQIYKSGQPSHMVRDNPLVSRNIASAATIFKSAAGLMPTQTDALVPNKEAAGVRQVGELAPCTAAGLAPMQAGELAQPAGFPRPMADGVSPNNVLHGDTCNPLTRLSYSAVLLGPNQVQKSTSPQLTHSSQTPIETDVDSEFVPPCKPISEFQGKKAVLFQIEDKSALVAKHKYVLLGKFSHGRPSWLKIQHFFHDLKLTGLYNISIFDNKHLYIECSNSIDFQRIWLRLHWTVDGCPMRILKWTPEFTPEIESPVVPVWIRLKGIPFYMFEKLPLWQIAHAVGKPIKIDSRNLNRTMLNTARVCVEMDISKPGIESFMVCFEDESTGVVQEHFKVDVLYDAIPHYCSACYHVGHNRAACKRLPTSTQQADVPQELQRRKNAKSIRTWTVAKSLPGDANDKGKGVIREARVVATARLDLTPQTAAEQGSNEAACTALDQLDTASKSAAISLPQLGASVARQGLQTNATVETNSGASSRGAATAALHKGKEIMAAVSSSTASPGLIRDEPVEDQVDGAAAEQGIHDGAIVLWDAADSGAQPAVVCAINEAEYQLERPALFQPAAAITEGPELLPTAAFGRQEEQVAAAHSDAIGESGLRPQVLAVSTCNVFELLQIGEHESTDQPTSPSSPSVASSEDIPRPRSADSTLGRKQTLVQMLELGPRKSIEQNFYKQTTQPSWADEVEAMEDLEEAGRKLQHKALVSENDWQVVTHKKKRSLQDDATPRGQILAPTTSGSPKAHQGHKARGDISLDPDYNIEQLHARIQKMRRDSPQKRQLQAELKVLRGA